MRFVCFFLIGVATLCVSWAEENKNEIDTDLNGAYTSNVATKTCSQNQVLLRGKCVKKNICVSGQKYDKSRNQCVKLCRKGEMYIRKTKSCQKRCARGEIFDLESNQCKKNPCPQGQVMRNEKCRCIRVTKSGRKKDPECDSKETKSKEEELDYEDYMDKETEEEDDSGVDDADYGNDYEGNDDELTSDEDYQELINDEDRKEVLAGLSSLEEEIGTIDVNNAFVYFPSIRRTSKKRAFEIRLKHTNHWFSSSRHSFGARTFFIYIYSDRFMSVIFSRINVKVTSENGHHLRPSITVSSEQTGKSYEFGQLNFLNPKFRCLQRIDSWKGPITTCVRPRDFFEFNGGNGNVKVRMCFEVFFPLYEFGVLLCYGVEIDRPAYSEGGKMLDVTGANDEMYFTIANGGDRYETVVVNNYPGPYNAVEMSVVERFMEICRRLY